MAEVDEGSGRAHGPERSGGDDVHFLCGFLRSLLPDEVHDLLGGHDDRFAGTDLIVDLIVCLRQLPSLLLNCDDVDCYS